MFQAQNNNFKHIQKPCCLFDGLGSVSAITNSEGIPIKHYHYDPYGNLRNTDNDPLNSFTFVGRYGGRKDWETGFTQFLHRWYDAKTGKWISRDPIGVTGGVNLYSYTSNNPVNLMDIFGLCPQSFPLPVADTANSERNRRCNTEFKSCITNVLSSSVSGIVSIGTGVKNLFDPTDASNYFIDVGNPMEVLPVVSALGFTVAGSQVAIGTSIMSITGMSAVTAAGISAGIGAIAAGAAYVAAGAFAAIVLYNIVDCGIEYSNCMSER